VVRDSGTTFRDTTMRRRPGAAGNPASPESGDRVLGCSVGPYPLAIGLVLDLPPRGVMTVDWWPDDIPYRRSADAGAG